MTSFDLLLIHPGIKPLKKLCLSLIVSCLKEHGLPNPDPLLDYVAPTVMQLVMDAYKAHTHVVTAS